MKRASRGHSPLFGAIHARHIEFSLVVVVVWFFCHVWDKRGAFESVFLCGRGRPDDIVCLMLPSVIQAQALSHGGFADASITWAIECLC